MGYYIDIQGNYYEGDRINISDQIVTKRLSPYYTWINSSWVFDKITAIHNANINIDKKAEEVRKKYLTSEPLQSITYLLKENDALAYKSAGYPIPFDEFKYPYVWAEMTANSDATAQIAADRIISEADQFSAGTINTKGKGPLIEKERRLAKINISNSLTEQEVTTAETNGLNALSLL